MTTATSKDIVFIDASIANGDALLDRLPVDSQVVWLDADLDGLSQIAAALAAHDGVTGVHIISHGSAGMLQLGSAAIGLNSFDSHAADFAAIRAALAPGADLLLYGCDVAAGPSGQAFIHTLAAATGADVAASTGLTGAAAMGGDWVLEASTGAIETAAIVASAMHGTLAAPVINNLDAEVTYTEGGAPVVIDSNMTLGGGSAYGGGYVRYALNASNSADLLALNSAANPNASGAVSVDAGTVYLGNGSGKEAIGSIDATLNGQNGKALQINFSANFTNPSFESNGGSVTGWTIGTEWVNLGTTKIGGFTSPEDPTHAPNSGGDNEKPASASFNSQLAPGGSDASSGGGSYSLRLYSSMTTAQGYDVVHGPYAMSNAFQASQGDVLYFDWKAAGGSDAFDAFGYLLNADTGTATIVLNRTGTSASESTPWTTASVTVPGNGNYRFVFVSGTWDATGGKAAGGSLYIDNFKVFGNKVNDAVATSIAQQITYRNSAEDAPASRELTVTVADGNGATSSAKTALKVAGVNDAPILTGGAFLPGVLEDASNPVGATVRSLFGNKFTDPDNAYSPTDSLAGIVVVGDASTPAQGNWQYSTDNGASWHDIGAVSASNGLLLDANAKLRFMPAADYPSGAAAHGAAASPGALHVHAVDSSHTGGYASGVVRKYFDTTSDGGSSAVSAVGVNLTTTVTEVNDAPRFTPATLATPNGSIADTAANDSAGGLGGAGTGLSGRLEASDPERDGFSFGVRGGVDDGAGHVVRTGLYGTLSVDKASGAWTYTPNPVAINAVPAGARTVDSFEFKVTDALGASSVMPYSVDIAGMNDKPEAHGGSLPDLTAATSNWAYQLPSTAFTDAEGSGLTYTATLADGTPLPAGIAFDAQARTFTTTGAAPGAYVIRVKADDTAAAVEHDFTLTVANSAPILNKPLGPQVVAANAPWSIQIPANMFVDPDNDPLSYSVWMDGTEITASGAKIGFDPASGILSGDGSPLAGRIIEVRASDGAAIATADFQLKLGTGTGTAPAAGTAIPSQTWTGAGDKMFQVPANAFDIGDGPGVPQHYAATLADGSALPGWLTFDAATGTFSGNPPADAAGTLALKLVSVYDGVERAARSFDLNIFDPNDAPALSAAAALADQTHATPTNWSLNVGTLFTDADGDDSAIVYSARLANGDPLPSWLSFDPVAKSFSGIPTGGAAYLNIVVSGTDAGGKSGSTSFTLNLQDITDSSTVGTNDTNTVGTVSVTDLNGNTLLQGDTLRAAVTDANGLRGAVTYQWQSSTDGNTWTDIANANAADFTLGQAQVNQQVRVQAFYLDAGGVAESPVANALGPVINVNDAGVLNFSGALSVGSELRANLSDIDGLAGAEPSYQWETSSDNVSWTAIAGATYGSYTIVDDDGGKYIRVRATYTDDLNSTETAVANGGRINIGTVAPVASDVSVGATERGGQNNATGGNDPSGNLLAAVTDANAGDTKAIQSLRAGAAEGLGADAEDGGATLTIRGKYGSLVVNKATGAYTYTVEQGNPDVEALNLGSSLADSFNYTVVDGSGLTDTAVLTVSVNGANDAPTVNASPSVTVLEDMAANIDLSSIVINDIDGGSSFSFKLVASQGTLAAASAGNVSVSGSGTGTLILTGSRADVNAFLAAADAIRYTGALDDNGNPGASIGLFANDGGGEVKVSEASVAIGAVNDAPAGTDGAVTILEDTAHAIRAADFGFTDPKDAVSGTANKLAAVIITSLPLKGSLELDGLAVTAGQTISVADIDAGKLVFTPAANANGTAYASFGFQVQDDGGTADGGADTDASANTLTVHVTPVNDAPVLVNAGSSAPKLTTIDENQVSSNGNLISDLVRPTDGGGTPADGEAKSFFTDVDYVTQGAAGAPGESWNGGVAIHALRNDGPADGGIWQFSTDGGQTWSAVGVVGEGQALLLSATDKIRFVPDTENGANASFDYYLWDGSSGTHGLKASVAVRGGSSAFSLDGDRADIVVTHVNDAPRIDLDGTAAGTGFATKYLIRGEAVAIAASDMRITDVDKLGPAQRDTITSATVAITDGAADNLFGTLYETLTSSAGASYQGSLGPIAISGNGSAALTLTGVGTWADYEAAIKSITYLNANPNAFHGVRTVTVKVYDGAITDPGHSLAGTAVASIDNIWAPVIDTNGVAEGVIYTTTYTEDAPPVRIASADSTITDEDSHLSSVSVSISNVMDAGHETLRMSADSVLSLSKLGVNVSGNGTTSITLAGNVAPSLFQLALRSISYANTSQQPDQTQRVIKIQSVDIDGQQGDPGYSHINVVSVQDAPTVAKALPDLPGTANGDPGHGSGTRETTIPADTFVDVDGDTLTYSATLEDGSPLPSWLSFDPSTRKLSGNPPASADGSTLTIKVTATDPFGNSGSDIFTWSFKDTNDLPTAALPLADQTKTGAGELSFALPLGSFTDADGEQLSYTANLRDGNDSAPLPAWLHFDPVSRSFSGNPPAGTTSPLTVRVTATDPSGASAHDDFVITLGGNLNDLPTVGTQPPSRSYTVGDSVNFTLPASTFADGDGDTLSIVPKIVKADGSLGDLPSWLSFDPLTRTFNGNAGSAVDLTIRLTATDGHGGEISTDFKLAAQSPNTAPSAPVDGDNDGQPDDQEIGVDTDGDGIPDNLDDNDDNDGVLSIVEARAPALSAGGKIGDGNGDGIADTRQVNVSSAPLVRKDAFDANGGPLDSYVTLVADSYEGKVLPTSTSKLLSLQQVDSPANLPVGMNHPLGMIAFTSKVASAGATESFSLYVDKSLNVNGYWKVDKFGDWVNLASAEYGGKVVVEGDKLRLDFKIADGGQFDADGKADGIISDPGAAGWGVTTKHPDDIDNDQFPDHLEGANGLVVGTKDNDVFSSSKLFVMQMYRDMLFREAEPEGLAFWMKLIDNGVLDRAQVANAFLHSSEFEDMTGTVARLYFGALKRLPDDAGLSTWLDAMKGGMDSADVAAGFAASTEFNSVYGSLDNASYVSQLYQDILHRAATEAELGNWTAKMGGGASRGDVLLGVTNSTENIALLDDAVSLALGYAGLLGRTPDQAGFDFWMDKLDQGVSQDDVIAGFIGVPEFHDRFLP
ncbi:putative Ig domain-containing protein [Massilia sp. UBA6681]|uniref:putative Ig domain-containing protein n=1 Tax=Massilia sp. UBA6681 TaxID=1946839 RepID=UPI0025C05F95|nr:putative Ig domain-containing protein [Massilia sp. UBA6681]